MNIIRSSHCPLPWAVRGVGRGAGDLCVDTRHCRIDRWIMGAARTLHRAKSPSDTGTHNTAAVHVATDTHTRTHTHAYVHTHTHAYVHTHTDTHTHTHGHRHGHTHTHTHTHTRTHKIKHVHAPCQYMGYTITHLLTNRDPHWFVRWINRSGKDNWRVEYVREVLAFRSPLTPSHQR